MALLLKLSSRIPVLLSQVIDKLLVYLFLLKDLLLGLHKHPSDIFVLILEFPQLCNYLRPRTRLHTLQEATVLGPQLCIESFQLFYFIFPGHFCLVQVVPQILLALLQEPNLIIQVVNDLFE